jgi:hypothetical protein
MIVKDRFATEAQDNGAIVCPRCHRSFIVLIVRSLEIEKEKSMIKLGQKVKDKVTGFTGIATSKVEYLNGCVQFCVKPEMVKPGEMPEGVYLDDMQLEVIGDGVAIPTEPDGGPMPDTPAEHYAG